MQELAYVDRGVACGPDVVAEVGDGQWIRGRRSFGGSGKRQADAMCRIDARAVEALPFTQDQSENPVRPRSARQERAVGAEASAQEDDRAGRFGSSKVPERCVDVSQQDLTVIAAARSPRRSAVPGEVERADLSGPRQFGGQGIEVPRAAAQLVKAEQNRCVGI